MSKKFLGRVIAGAALGCAPLLMAMPGIAMADGPHGDGREWGGDKKHWKSSDGDGRQHGWDGNHDGASGFVVTKPKHVKAGHEVKIVEICKEPQEEAWVWSKVTGKVALAPVEEHGKGENGSDWKKEESGHQSGGNGGSDGNSGQTSKKERFAYWAKVELPKDVHPGTYEVKGSCGTGTLTVVPHGWVDGGDGGSAGTNRAVLGGVGILGVAALGGTLLMRRRSVDGTLA